MTRTPRANRPQAHTSRAGTRWAGVGGGGTAGRLGLALGLALALTGCSLDGLLNSDQLPPDVADPTITQTPQGALAAYHGTVAQFGIAFGGGVNEGDGSVIVAAGLLSDELVGVSPLGYREDLRALPEPGANSVQYVSASTYSRLQKVRGQAGQAIGLLTRYRPEDPALAGRLYALQGYAELFLAELFCSGIPLSTVDFEGDYTYQPGSSTEQVLAHARVLFDTALALGGDSVNTVYLAHAGQARALLASGRYAEAAVAAALVPDDYRDTLVYPGVFSDSVGSVPNFARAVGNPWLYGIADQEGNRGLDYVTSGDPRTPVSSIRTLPVFGTQWYPSNYRMDGSSSLTWASGVEARLIEAEAALQANPDPGSSPWLDKLNALRTDGTFTTSPTPDLNDDPAALDTLWHAGSGGVDSLGPLADPGTDSARVSLVFRERAFWLFLTGHRQGDLRRLLHDPWYKQYWPTQDRVYPIGQFLGNGFISQYGSDVTLPIPYAERVLNPRFTGCFSRQP